MKYAIFLWLASSVGAWGQGQYAFTNFVGSPGGPGNADGIGSAARFKGPSGVAVDCAGNVYVADTYNAMIRKVSAAGVVTTLAGSVGVSGSADGVGSAAWFGYPVGVAVDGKGYLYVADSLNNRITKGTPVLALGIGWSDGLPRLSVTGGVGSRYALEYVSAVSANNQWVSVMSQANFALTNSPQFFLDSSAIGAPQRFYRVRQQVGP